MFVIVVSDGDIDYTYVFGPFETEKEATDFLNSNISDDYGGYEQQARVVALKNKSKLADHLED